MSYFSILMDDAKVAAISDFLDAHQHMHFRTVAKHFAKEWGEPVDEQTVKDISYTRIFIQPQTL
jgi:hypothetical protein